MTLVLAVLVLVVMLSQKPGAIILILLGLAATAASFPLSAELVTGFGRDAPPRR